MKALDFNALTQPTWQITLKDDAHTVVNITAPTVDMVERLIAAGPELTEASNTKDGRTIQAVYALTAEIMNCNDDGYTFTAEELRDKYRLTLLDVFRLHAGYMEFIQEVQNAKN